MSLTDVPVARARPAEPVPWQGLVEALDEVVLLLNAQHVVAYASPAAGPRLGYEPHALAGRPLGDLVHPDDLRQALRNLAELETVGVARQAVRLRRADGAYAWLECSLTRPAGAVPPADGGPAAAPTVMPAVTVLTAREGATRVTLEARLATVDHRYRTLLGALTEAVVLVDGRLRIEEVNDEAAVLLGAPAQALLGRSWFEAIDLCDEDGRPLGAEGPLAASLVTAPTRRELWATLGRRDGRSSLVRLRWTPLDGGSDGLRGYVVTLQDATAGRAAASLPQQRLQARTAAGLTPREHEVLERLARGQDATEIARVLRLSVYSVRGHIKSLMRKLGVHSQLQAVVLAARRGIVDVVDDAAAEAPQHRPALAPGARRPA